MEQSTKVKTGKVRFSYANVFVPTSMDESQEKKYSVVLLIPKSDERTVKAIKAGIAAAVEAGKATKFAGKSTGIKLPLRDGDEEKPDSPEYKGCYFLSCSSKNKPGIVDKQLNELTDDEEFYSGCYGRATVNFYAYNVNGVKGIAAGLGNLQKLEDGERFSGKTSAEDDFSDDFEDDDL